MGRPASPSPAIAKVAKRFASTVRKRLTVTVQVATGSRATPPQAAAAKRAAPAMRRIPMKNERCVASPVSDLFCLRDLATSDRRRQCAR